MGWPTAASYPMGDYTPGVYAGGGSAWGRRRPTQRVGTFRYDAGTLAGSTDLYGNEYDTEGLPTRVAAPVRQHVGFTPWGTPLYEGDAPIMTIAGDPANGASPSPTTTDLPPGDPRVDAALGAYTPPGARAAGGGGGRFLSPQNLQRAHAMGYDPIIFEDLIASGLSPAEAEQAAMTMAARTGLGAMMGTDPRTGQRTLAGQEQDVRLLGESFREDQRYRGALADAAQQRMAAEQAANSAEEQVGTRRENAIRERYQRAIASAPMARLEASATAADPRIAEMEAEVAADRQHRLQDPMYWRAVTAAKSLARGGVTQATQQSRGQLDRRGPSFDQVLNSLYGNGGR